MGERNPKDLPYLFISCFFTRCSYRTAALRSDLPQPPEPPQLRERYAAPGDFGLSSIHDVPNLSLNIANR